MKTNRKHKIVWPGTSCLWNTDTLGNNKVYMKNKSLCPKFKFHSTVPSKFGECMKLRCDWHAERWNTQSFRPGGKKAIITLLNNEKWITPPNDTQNHFWMLLVTSPCQISTCHHLPLMKANLTDTAMLISKLTRFDSFCIFFHGTPRVFTMLADRQRVPIALTQFCLCWNLLDISVVYK